jgi:hypothetical protein
MINLHSSASSLFIYYFCSPDQSHDFEYADNDGFLEELLNIPLARNPGGFLSQLLQVCGNNEAT